MLRVIVCSGHALSATPLAQLCSDGVQRTACTDPNGGGGDTSDNGIIAGLSLIVVIIIAAGIVLLLAISIGVCYKKTVCCFRSKAERKDTRTNLELSSAL